MRGGSRRLALALGLVVVLTAAPLAFLWVSGLAGAELEAAALREAPVREAREAAARLARRVGDRLVELAAREDARPYFHWQHFIVDPRGAYAGDAVVPSPLADGSDDPLVSDYFQVGEDGAVTSPEVFAAAGEPPAGAVARLAALKASVVAARVEVPPLPAAPPVAEEPVVAQGPARSLPNAAAVANVDSLENEQLDNRANASVKVQKLDQRVYAQNQQVDALYEQIQQKQQWQPQPAEPREVVVRVGPLAWRTLVVEGEARPVATRAVETPDGRFAQGLVVSVSALAASLEDGGLRGELAPRTGEAGVTAAVPVAGLDWVVRVAPAPAAAEADAVVEGFVVRAASISGLALLVAALVMALLVQAERLLERRQRFAAAAAHELRTPLAGLRMYAEMLAHGLGRPEKQRLYAERLADEAARLGRVVGNVLEFTRLEKGGLQVKAADGEVSAVVREVMARLEAPLAAAGVKVELEVAEAHARFDADALAQIVANLVDNAEKYSRGAADRTLTVSVRPEVDGVEVWVRDRGPGLPASLRRRLFRPFSRGAPADGPAGLGLGLALSRALTRAQGGELTWRDADPGTVMIVRLPRARGPGTGA